MLQLEVIGVNYWNSAKRPFDVAVLRNLSGLSLTATYADRDGMRDSGIGVLLTFDKVYLLGVTRYGSETGVSMSLDLANMFRDKLKQRYEAWKGKLKSKEIGLPHRPRRSEHADSHARRRSICKLLPPVVTPVGTSGALTALPDTPTRTMTPRQRSACSVPLSASSYGKCGSALTLALQPHC